MENKLPFGSVTLIELLSEAATAITRSHDGALAKNSIGMNKMQCGNGEYPAFARYGLPYGLDPLDENRAIVVNRNYKPVGIGVRYGHWVDYELFPQWHITGEMLKRVRAAKCWWRDSDQHFMYNDGCPPWVSARHCRAYEARLHLLISTLKGMA